MHHTFRVAAIFVVFNLLTIVCCSQQVPTPTRTITQAKAVDVKGCLDADLAYSISPCDPLTLNFTGSGNSSQNPEWNFGDGTLITGVLSASHTYTAEGNYTVTYTLSNGVCTDAKIVEISVRIVKDDVIITPDTTICGGSSKQLRSGNILKVCWNPASYLDDPTSQSPVTSTPVNITYFLTGLVPGVNLITNGNFSSGNTGFFSDYSYAANNQTEAQYFVGTNPVGWNINLSACKDHGSGTGNMMLVNGSTNLDAIVWRATIPVTPNTNYAFSTWIQSLASLNPAVLQFSINGQNLGGLINAGFSACVWSEFYTAWNSGASTTATIAVVNRNTIADGNDFALDDISFAPFLIKRDSVRITVEKPVVIASNDTTVCMNTPLQLRASGTQSYAWTPSIGLNNTAIPNPVASNVHTVGYIVTGTSANGCSAKDTVIVGVFAATVISVSNDTIICQNSSIQLESTGGVIYHWSPSGTISNPDSQMPVVSPTISTTYVVDVADFNGCPARDSVRVSLRPRPIFTVSPQRKVCSEDSVQLSATGGDIYHWSPSAGMSNPSIANPRVSPESTTLYNVQITETTCNESVTLPVSVVVHPLPVVSASSSNDLDCSTGSSQLTVHGAASYIWSPVSGLSDPTSSNPKATPLATTLYTVTGTDPFGCSDTANVAIEVKNTLSSGYLMPSAFTPNNDGVNDCYSVSYWGVIKDIQFSIYNRWGDRIFYTTQSNTCWDGTFKGTKQDPGVYIYLIRANTLCETGIVRKGTFVLLR